MSSNAHRLTSERPRFDVADVFRKYIGEYKKTHRLSYEQSKAVSAIINCRTPAMGGLLKRCNECSHWEFSYRSCKNRYCPTCGSFEKAQWLEAQKVWVLPIQYYHVVFTIDHVFNPLVWHNQEQMYALIIEVAAKMLKEYGRRYLGGELGFTLILHTWGQTMQPHPHVHFIVTGGALVRTADGYRWQPAQHKYLFPVKRLSGSSREFKSAFCAAVRQLWQVGELDTLEGQLDVSGMLAEAEGKDWEVYIQAPPCGLEKLLDYLARYIFRIAISNHRILAIEHGQVTFTYYDNRTRLLDGQGQGALKQMTLPAEEFIRRFLMHVLPRRFVRIRHYGLHHSSCRHKLRQARRLLGLPAALPVVVRLNLLDWLKSILKSEADPRLCPHCGKGIMLPVREFAPLTGWRARLLPILGLCSRWQPGFA